MVKPAFFGYAAHVHEFIRNLAILLVLEIQLPIDDFIITAGYHFLFALMLAFFALPVLAFFFLLVPVARI
ncbi:unnamed protein product [Gongylonema pulchrum]|uniref:Transmembrane protein 107 n=1 Tax=Gongylonema pulchrum TaxID=637853 RepID=A0A183F1M5_9BILA|nr:unnamed protein product [Gongylonema pulchrum]